jgi:enoyl-CoA hydratase
MPSQPIEYETLDHVAHVWLNRPEKRNAINHQSLAMLDQAITSAEGDPNIRVIVLRGRSGTFCAGFDLDDLQHDLSAPGPLSAGNAMAAVCNRLFGSTRPTVAVLEGYTTAAGFELMINCDFAIAAEDAKIGDFLMRRALFGGAGPIHRLPRLIGLRRTKELLLTGKLLSGVEASDWGLVNACAPTAELDASVGRFVGELADKSPFCMQITKLAVNQGLDGDTGTLQAVERLANGLVQGSQDAAEGVAAFLEKRKPVWSGS